MAVEISSRAAKGEEGKWLPDTLHGPRNWTKSCPCVSCFKVMLLSHLAKIKHFPCLGKDEK